jgi:hypothetical protein
MMHTQDHTSACMSTMNDLHDMNLEVGKGYSQGVDQPVSGSTMEEDALRACPESRDGGYGWVVVFCLMGMNAATWGM